MTFSEKLDRLEQKGLFVERDSKVNKASHGYVKYYNLL